MSLTMQRPIQSLQRSQPTRDTPAKPSIRLVPPRTAKKRRPRFFYAMVAVVVIFVIIITQLVLSVLLSGGAYEIASLQAKSKELTRTLQSRTQDLDRLGSPQNLAANAEALGMVANNTPVYLRLSDGAILGSPVAASPDAGVIAGADTGVSNSLLAGVPLVTDVAAQAAAEKKLAKEQSQKDTTATPANPKKNAQNSAANVNPLTDGLPSVSTH